MADRLRVSYSMKILRETQGELNRYWQASELAFKSMFKRLEDGGYPEETQLHEVFGDVDSNLWVKNNRGKARVHFDVGKLLEVSDSLVAEIYMSTIVSFYSSFEFFLEDRVGSLRIGNRWGPLITSLSHGDLLGARTPLRLRTILTADLFRHVRNKIIHGSYRSFPSVEALEAYGWMHLMAERAREPFSREVTSTICAEVINSVIEGASRKAINSKKDGRVVPKEYFYMLFCFTALDDLAVEIEEALQPLNHSDGPSVGREESRIRRKDLVV